MRTILTVTAALFAVNSSWGASNLVYMGEREGSKQIYLADGNGKHAQAITKGARWHLYPDIDSTGEHVVYVEGDNESLLDVYSRNLKTGETQQHTKGEGRYLHPDFSGDGRALAVSGPFGPDKKARVVIWSLAKPGDVASKREGQTVVDSEFDGYFPSLASDASFVVFQRTKSPKSKDIALYDVVTKKTKALTPENEVAMSPSLSADDMKVAYTSPVGQNWEIFIQTLSNGQRVKVTSDPAHDFAPTFRPDGSLVFASDRTGRFQLYAISAEAIANQTYAVTSIAESDEDLYAPSASGEVEFSQRLMPSIPAPARSSFGAIRVANRIYVMGGHQGAEHTYPPESFMDAVEIYDPSLKTWSKGAPRPVPCHGYGIAKHGKFIYAFGGFAYSANHNPKWQSLDSVDRYDTEENVWTTVAKLPRKRSSNVVAQVGNKVYLLGGWDSTPRFDKDYDGVFHREVDVFDLETEKATATNIVVPNPLRRALSGVVRGNEIILIGGLGVGASHFELLDQVTAFNVENGTWRELTRLPFATFAPAAGALGDRLFVFGGMFKTGEMEFRYVNHIFALGRDTAAWKHTGRFVAESKGFSQVVDLDATTLGILGGHSSEGEANAPVKTFETFGLGEN